MTVHQKQTHFSTHLLIYIIILFPPVCFEACVLSAVWKWHDDDYGDEDF